MANHHIIYTPGLHDQSFIQRFAVKLLPAFWNRRGFYGHIIAPGWETGDFESKLRSVITKIDELTNQGHFVSLVGQSAGSSLALNAFVARREFVAGLVILTGRLREAGEPSLDYATRHSPAFAESVRRAEIALNRLPAVDRLRIITIRPSVDKVVPSSSVPIKGAINLKSRLRGHSFGGAMLASFASGQWLTFLSSINNELTMADLVIEAMPFSDEIIAWSHAHPEFKEALKVTNPDRFYPLGMITTTHTKNVPDDLVIGFIAYDMQTEIFKQDFIVDIGNKHREFVLYSKHPEKRYGKYVHHIKDFYARYGQNGDYANTHHIDLDYILAMGNDELSERTQRAVKTSKEIVAAGGRREVSQQELRGTLAKIRTEKEKFA
ncbi:MAG TPA: hypothetical protein VGO07_07040 [Candidatus Saccharimonadales bacterium]|jgi:hypothetical protein|nr:hypothetical protein [Candidatus Saccharimonadales bacterium]